MIIRGPGARRRCCPTKNSSGRRSGSCGPGISARSESASACAKATARGQRVSGSGVGKRISAAGACREWISTTGGGSCSKRVPATDTDVCCNGKLSSLTVVALQTTGGCCRSDHGSRSRAGQETCDFDGETVFEERLSDPDQPFHYIRTGDGFHYSRRRLQDQIQANRCTAVEFYPCFGCPGLLAAQSFGI